MSCGNRVCSPEIISFFATFIGCATLSGTMRKTAGLPVLFIVLLVLAASAGCSQNPSGSSGATAQTTAAAESAHLPVTATGKPIFTLHAAGIADGTSLPRAYTCGAGMPASPPVTWENVPEGTKTLTLIVDDPDAPSGTFTHWIVYNIPPERTEIPEDVGGVKEIAGGGQQGTSSADQRGYYPACPPIGSRHRYVFTLYAVDYTMGLPVADRDVIDVMLDGHWIEKAVVTTYFAR